MKKIYLASPFFNNSELARYNWVIAQLRGVGYEVYVPQEHEIENAWELSNEDWARAVYLADIKALREADVVMVLNFGMYSDSGTAWEAGYAYGLDKEVVHILCGGENATYSLMMINGNDKVVDYRILPYWEDNAAHADISKIIQK